MSYCTTDDFELYLEGFIEEIYGDLTMTASQEKYDADVDRFFRRVNEVLKGVSGIKAVPVGKVNGKYPESLIEWQCKWHICQKLLARKSLEWGNELPDFYLQLKADARDIERAIMAGKIVFDDQIAEREYGINPAIPVGTVSGVAYFYSDYQRYDTPYLGENYITDYLVEITGVTDALSIEGAKFRFSKDEGETWSGDLDTGTEWARLDVENVSVRWARPKDYNGTSALYVVKDKWRFQCIPNNVLASPGRRSKQSFLRR